MTDCGCHIVDGQVIVYCSLHDAAPALYDALRLLIKKAELFDIVYNSEFDEARLAILAADGERKCSNGAPSKEQGRYCATPTCELCRARKGACEVAR
jgi:hypothetical protein